MFSNPKDIKPWFKDDIARTLTSIYFAHKKSSLSDADRQHQIGFAAGIASVALAVGINPEQILEPEDIQAIRKIIEKGM